MTLNPRTVLRRWLGVSALEDHVTFWRTTSVEVFNSANAAQVALTDRVQELENQLKIMALPNRISMPYIQARDGAKFNEHQSDQ